MESKLIVLLDPSLKTVSSEHANELEYPLEEKPFLFMLPELRWLRAVLSLLFTDERFCFIDLIVSDG